MSHTANTLWAENLKEMGDDTHNEFSEEEEKQLEEDIESATLTEY